MQLRSFRPSDFETLFRIDQACFPRGISYSRAELASYIAQPVSKTWVAEEGGAVVGFTVADRQPKQVGHIITVDVVEASRRRGVGNALMDAAEDWARSQGLRLVYLETAEDNRNAQQFYQARGYEKVRKIEHYYSNGTAAWIMVKRLRNESKVDSQQSKVKKEED